MRGKCSGTLTLYDRQHRYLWYVAKQFRHHFAAEMGNSTFRECGDLLIKVKGRE